MQHYLIGDAIRASYIYWSFSSAAKGFFGWFSPCWFLRRSLVYFLTWFLLSVLILGSLTYCMCFIVMSASYLPVYSSQSLSCVIGAWTAFSLLNCPVSSHCFWSYSSLFRCVCFVMPACSLRSCLALLNVLVLRLSAVWFLSQEAVSALFHARLYSRLAPRRILSLVSRYSCTVLNSFVDVRTISISLV